MLPAELADLTGPDLATRCRAHVMAVPMGECADADLRAWRNDAVRLLDACARALDACPDLFVP